MNNFKSVSFAVLLSIAIAYPLSAQIPTYGLQTFEALDINSPSVLDEEGWLVGASVTDNDGVFLYQYFADDSGVPFPAPNAEAFSSIASGGGGENQGEQYLNVFSDYNNQEAGHAVGNIITTFFYQGGNIAADELNETFRFEFDFRRADDPFGPGADVTTNAYVRILSPAPDFFLIFEDLVDTTAATTDWVEGVALEVTIADDLEGFIFQYGFSTSASNNEPSGVYYDNIRFGTKSDCLVGDINGDGVVTLLDVAGFVDAINNMGVTCEADVNEDGSVDLLDVSPFIDILSGA